MRLLYCYTEFLDEKGNPKPFRGLDEIDLNLSTDLVFEYDKDNNSLNWHLRDNPLPPNFWANEKAQKSKCLWTERGAKDKLDSLAQKGSPRTDINPAFPFGEIATNIYNINIVAGCNGSGKTTVINYLVDLLYYVYKKFDKYGENIIKNSQFEVYKNRNILVFETVESHIENGSQFTEKTLFVVDILPPENHSISKVSVNESALSSYCAHSSNPYAGTGRVIIVSNKENPSKSSQELFDSHMQSLKSVFMTNTLSQSDYERNAGLRHFRRTDQFVFDCSLASGICYSPDISQFFLNEVYKQVKYMLDRSQVEVRNDLHHCVDELKLANELIIIPRVNQLENSNFQKAFPGLYSRYYRIKRAASNSFETLPELLALLCLESYIENIENESGIRFQIVNKLQEDITLDNADSLFSCVITGIEDVEKEFLSTLPNRSPAITCIAQLPNGDIVTGSDDNTIYIWNLNFDEPKASLKGHKNWVRCLAILPNGNIVSGSDDNTVRIWDHDKGECTKTLSGHTGEVHCVAVLSDSIIASGSRDNTIRVWDTTTGACIRTIYGHDDTVSALATLSDNLIVSGSWDKTIRLWDATSGNCLRTLSGHTGPIRCIAILPDERIVSGSTDHTIRIWDRISGEYHILNGHKGLIRAVSVLLDGRIVSCSDDETIRIWAINSFKCDLSIVEKTGPIFCIAALNDGTFIAGYRKNTLRIWDSKTGKLAYPILKTRTPGIKCLAAISSHKCVCGVSDGSLRVWDIINNRCIAVLNGHTASVQSLAVLADGRIVSGSMDGTIRIWNEKTKQCLAVLEGHRSVDYVAALPDGRIVSSSYSTYDKSFRIWDTTTYECIQHIDWNNDGLISVALLPGARIICSSNLKLPRIFDANTGKGLVSLQVYSTYVDCFAVLPNGRIVTGSDDGNIRIFDPDTGDCLTVLYGHSACIRCLAILPNGNIVSGSDDGDLRLWDARAEECIAVLRGHSGIVRTISVLPNERIISGSNDKTLRIWDTKTGKCIAELIGHSERVNCVLSLLSGRIVSGADDNTLRVWDSETGRLLNTLSSDNAVSSMHLLKNACLDFVSFMKRELVQFSNIERLDTDEFRYKTKTNEVQQNKEFSLFMSNFMLRYRDTIRDVYFIDYSWGLSSGEENMLRLFSNLFQVYNNENNSNSDFARCIVNRDRSGVVFSVCDSILLFMDEADLTLHPEWQRRLIHVLTAFIPRIYPPSCAKDIQIVLSTHSPLLLGDIPKENIYYLGRDADDSIETFGQNIHTILKDGFFLNHGTVGEFAATRINHIAKRLGEIIRYEKARFNGENGVCADPEETQADPVARKRCEGFVNPTEEELVSIRQTIDLVASGILRARLESMWLEANALLGPADNTDRANAVLKSCLNLTPEEQRYLLRMLSREVNSN